jgi:hypothetical protein
MKSVFGLTLVGVILAAQLPSQAGGIPPGNWSLTTMEPTGAAETTSWIVNLERATVVAMKSSARKPEVGVDVKGDHIQFTLHLPGTE